MLRPEAVDARYINSEGEQIITPSTIKHRVDQILISREMVISGKHDEDLFANRSYEIDEEQATFHGFPAATVRIHWRTGEKSPSDLGISGEYKIFGKISEGRVSLELIEFEDKEPDISVVNQDTRTRVDLDEMSRSEQEEIARVMKISS